MQLISSSLTHGAPIDHRLCFGKLHPDAHMAFAANRSPHLKWEGAPQGTRSYAIACVDPDVPTVADDVNQEGRVVPADLPRCDFYHWLMVNIPASVTELSEGSCGAGVVEGGKSEPPGPAGALQGANDYTSFFEGSDLAGVYLGYDGPCPPWNDELLHHYHFVVYALDTERLDVPDAFRGPQFLEAMEGHVLSKATLVGTYTLNPDLARR